jgi:hypothetical protein
MACPYPPAGPWAQRAGLGEACVSVLFVPTTPPFDRDGSTAEITLPDDALEALDLRRDDRVIVAYGRTAEHGDLALIEEDGAEALWKVYPELDELILSTGVDRRTVPASSVRVLGVALAVLRRLPDPTSPRDPTRASGPTQRSDPT